MIIENNIYIIFLFIFKKVIKKVLYNKFKLYKSIFF